jgi:hypothetical protein
VLWLQTHYPDVFAGCWSSSPDPVDFRNFQRVNLYEEDNIYYKKNGTSNAVATIAGYFPVATMKQCYQQEFVLYRGEQMHSFNQVFSAKGADGQPIPICQPVTGAIDKSCFEGEYTGVSDSRDNVSGGTICAMEDAALKGLTPSASSAPDS